MTVRFCLAFVLSALAWSPAYAQATRTWVSGIGNDADPCSLTAPCKTFAGAYSKTLAGGEISVLTPGGFGAVTISKSLTINGAGEHGSVLGAGSNGIVVNAPGVVVTIRNIQLQGAGTGLIGIRLRQNSMLVVDNVSISGFQYGVHVDDGRAVVSNSSITSNQFVAASASGGSLTVTGTTMANNGTAVLATGGTIRVSNNVIVENTTNFGCGAGSVLSAGNNSVGVGASPCPPAGGFTVQ
jgi:hypothetical protein